MCSAHGRDHQSLLDGHVFWLFMSGYFGRLNREKAEDYLKFDVNVAGSYLVRQGRENQYVLSLKTWQQQDTKYIYRHYKIKQEKNGRKEMFSIGER